MQYYILKITKIIIISLIFTSCAKKQEIEGAISLFTNLNKIEIDESLKGQEIIPPQKDSKSWLSRSDSSNNPEIENFTFAHQIKKKKSINYGYKFLGKHHIATAPIIKNETAYLIDHKGRVTSLNTTNKKKNWQIKPFKTKFRNGKIYLNNNIIFATSGYNYLSAINAENGSVLWTKKLNSIIISSPIANKDLLFFITSDNKTYSLNANNGKIIWIHEGIDKNTAILGSSEPVFYKNYVFSSYSSGEIYILNQKNGEIGWFYNLNTNRAIDSDFILNDIDNIPIIRNDVVYAVGNGGIMMAIQIKNGNVIWQNNIASISDFWIAADSIYIINNDNKLLALDRISGKIKWYIDLKKKNSKEKTIYYGLIMAGDNLILSNSNKEIITICVKKKKIIKRKKFWNNFYHSPTIANKKIYFNILGKFSNKLLILE